MGITLARFPGCSMRLAIPEPEQDGSKSMCVTVLYWWGLTCQVKEESPNTEVKFCICLCVCVCVRVCVCVCVCVCVVCM